MSYKKLSQEYSPEELAESFVFPAKLSARQQKAAYLQLAGARRQFADEIGIDETLLSQLVNHHRTLPDYVPIRLELHSNNSIPAEYWFRVIEKDREGAMILNKTALRKRERRFVTRGISLRL